MFSIVAKRARTTDVHLNILDKSEIRWNVYAVSDIWRLWKTKDRYLEAEKWEKKWNTFALLKAERMYKLRQMHIARVRYFFTLLRSKMLSQLLCIHYFALRKMSSALLCALCAYFFACIIIKCHSTRVDAQRWLDSAAQNTKIARVELTWYIIHNFSNSERETIFTLK